MDLGSDVDHCGILTAIGQVAIPGRNGKLGLQTEILACTGQQLIPDLVGGYTASIYAWARVS